MALTRPKYSQIPDTDFKQSVRVATTADIGNVMLTQMPNTVDGISLNFYDRVLVRAQANAAQNGIYQVIAVGTGSNGIWERTKDANAGSTEGKVTPAIITLVEEGAINSGRTFRLTTTGNIDLGTTNLSFGVTTAEPAGSTGQLQFANLNNQLGGISTSNFDYATGNLTFASGNIIVPNLFVTTTALFQNGKRVPQITTSATPPAAPADGDQWYQTGTDILYEWINDGATSYWVDVTGATIANVNPITGTTVGTLVVNSGTDSTSTNTGALQVVGGVGISGNLNVGGAVSFGGGQFGTDLVISSNTTATSDTTGAIRIASPGGLGVGGNIWAGGTIVANSRIPSTSTTTGAIILPGIGGIGAGGNIWAGGDITALGNITGGGIRQTISSNAPSNPVVGDQWYQLGTDVLYQYVNDGTNKYWVDVTGATVANITAYNQQSLNDIAIVSGTPSISATSGALQVAGGVGVIGNIYLQGNLDVSGGNIIANQNVTSTSTVTGSMVVRGQGGIGVGGNVNIGGNLSVLQTATFAQNVQIAANLTSGGTYFSAAGLTVNQGNITATGFTVSNGNITATGNTAIISGLTITDGGIGNLTSLSVIGAATIGGNLDVTGRVTGGGIRKTSSATAPAGPVVGDIWYKTDTDVYYQYINDGTSNFWIDIAGATVSNASPTQPQSLQDINIVSGTASTNTTTGALVVTGGIGASGNINAGNVSANNISADLFTYANGVSILAGNEGTFSNANVTAYLAANSISFAGGNIVSSAQFFSTNNFSITNGNIVSTGALAVVGGLTIENGAIGNLAGLSVIGNGTISGNLAIDGNVTGGGIRKTTSTTAPVNPVVGDLWYKSDTDVLYQYINDGASNFWVDYVGATVSNASPTSPQSLQDLSIVSGTPSVSTTTGALTVTGGAGISGNINAGNVSAGTVSGSLFTFANGVNILAGNEGTYSNANVTAYLASSDISIGGNISASGSYFAAGGLSALGGVLTVGNVLSSGSKAIVGGLTIENGGFGNLASINVIGLATIGGDLAVTGNVSGGGLRKTASTTAPVNPVPGDVWYKTDTDVYYTYVNDGTNSYWIDYVGATVSNAAVQNSINNDFRIASGTESYDSDTGALTVVGGIGSTGNLFIGGLINANGNIIANSRVASTSSSTGALVIAGTGGLGVGGAMFVGQGANITTTLNVGTALNVGSTANIAGNFNTLGNISAQGRADITGNLDVVGRVTGGGIRKTTSVSAPAGPVVGDLWYKTDTDVLYQYVHDGTSNYWIDYVGPTISNAAFDYGVAYDFSITSGTASTDSESGAFQVVGGAGITGNIFAGGLISANGNIVANSGTTSVSTTTGAVVISGPGGIGVGGAAWIGASANIGTTLNVGTSGIIGTSLNVGGNIVGASNLAVAGRADIAGDVAITGNVTGGGIRKTTSLSAPVSPVVGDLWYKTDTDVLYQYINDGTSSFWVDYVGATVSNAAVDNSTNADFTITSGTPSTEAETGALRVAGGFGITGNIYAGGIISASGNLVANATTASGNTSTGALVVRGGAGIAGSTYIGGLLNVSQTLAVTGNISGANLLAGQGNFSSNIYAASALLSGRIDIIGSATVGGDLAVTGNVSGGGLRKTASTTAPVNPVPGDVWYKTDTDVYYTYVNDGTNSYWIDYIGATVSNASPTSLQSIQDLAVVGGTASTNTTSGAITVIGGVGVTGNINAGNITTTGTATVNSLVSNGAVQSASLSVAGNIQANGFSVLDGAISAANDITTIGNLLAVGLASIGGNLTSGGSYFSAGGMTSLDGNIGGWQFSITNGNITAYGQRAELGGLIIENGGFGNIASLGVIGSATIGGNLTITGNVTGGGIRKTSSLTAPPSPVVGDLWYKTDTDVVYQYINDGSNTFWVDYVGATVSNSSVDNSTNSDFTIASGTAATSYSTGALRVVGGAGITGNIFAGNNLSVGENIVAGGDISAQSAIFAANLTSSNISTGIISANSIGAGGFTAIANSLSIPGVFGVTATGNLTAAGQYFSAGGLSATAGNISATGFSVTNGNLIATGTTATIGGLVINNGGFGSLASLDVTGNTTVGGNVSVTGNITGGGLRKYAQTNAPVAPVVGDIWYKTDTDVVYEYINDGTSNFWVDLTSASVANVTASYDNLGDLNVVGNITVTGGFFRFANGTPYITTTLANTTNIVANISNGFNVGLDLTATGVAAGNYGSATSIPTLVVDNYGRVTSVTSNAVSTSFGLQGNVGSSTVTGGDTLVIVGVPNQIQTTVSGNSISIGFTPNISFTDFTVTGNLVYGENGLRTTTSATPPLNPTPGDMWYQTGTDILYRYINDGNSEYWVDFFSTPLRAILPEADIGGGDGEVQYNDTGTFGANANFSYDQSVSMLKVPRFRITQTQSPATPTSTGQTGEITWDAAWVYVCVAPNTWRRAGLYTW